MIDLLANPLFWAVTSVVCILALTFSWKNEKSGMIFRFVLAVALAGNATMLGLTVCC